MGAFRSPQGANEKSRTPISNSAGYDNKHESGFRNPLICSRLYYVETTLTNISELEERMEALSLEHHTLDSGATIVAPEIGVWCTSAAGFGGPTHGGVGVGADDNVVGSCKAVFTGLSSG